MFYNTDPKEFLYSRCGINLDRPTIRDAVALDIIKLDDSNLDVQSVSNDNVYTWPERITYSPMEYERFLLNKNFRINLVNLEHEWSKITYMGRNWDGEHPDEKVVARTVDRVYQGPRMSLTLL